MSKNPLFVEKKHQERSVYQVGKNVTGELVFFPKIFPKMLPFLLLDRKQLKRVSCQSDKNVTFWKHCRSATWGFS